MDARAALSLTTPAPIARCVHSRLLRGAMSSEIDETIKRLMAHKGILSVVIMNHEGIPIRTSPAAMEHFDAVKTCAEFTPLVTKVTHRTRPRRLLCSCTRCCARLLVPTSSAWCARVLRAAGSKGDPRT